MWGESNGSVSNLLTELETTSYWDRGRLARLKLQVHSCHG